MDDRFAELLAQLDEGLRAGVDPGRLLDQVTRDCDDETREGLVDAQDCLRLIERRAAGRPRSPATKRYTTNRWGPRIFRGSAASSCSKNWVVAATESSFWPGIRQPGERSP